MIELQVFYFGLSVTIMLVGSMRTGSDSGSAYVFIRIDNGNAWTQSAKLTPTVETDFSCFGTSVALNNDAGNQARATADGLHKIIVKPW